jgi:hypothetical protein
MFVGYPAIDLRYNSSSRLLYCNAVYARCSLLRNSCYKHAVGLLYGVLAVTSCIETVLCKQYSSGQQRCASRIVLTVEHLHMNSCCVCARTVQNRVAAIVYTYRIELVISGMKYKIYMYKKLCHS